LTTLTISGQAGDNTASNSVSPEAGAGQNDQQDQALSPEAKSALAVNNTLYAEAQKNLTTIISQLRVQMTSALAKQREQDEKYLKKELQEAKNIERGAKKHNIGFSSKGKTVVPFSKFAEDDRKKYERQIKELPVRQKEQSDAFDQSSKVYVANLRQTLESNAKQIRNGNPVTAKDLKSNFEGAVKYFSDQLKDRIECAKKLGHQQD